MTSAAATTGPLRLPVAEDSQSYTVRVESLFTHLEQLERREFNGRLELRTDDWRAELVLWKGHPVAVGLSGPGLRHELVGSTALRALCDQADVSWQCRVESFDAGLAHALGAIGADAGGGAPELSGDLRALIRALAQQGGDGVLEVSAGARWARLLFQMGALLGAYSADQPRLGRSLEPLGAVLALPEPRLRWYSADSLQPLALPVSEGAGKPESSPVERQVVWVTSRFEAAWSRARAEGGGPSMLSGVLRQLAETLLTLAALVESARGDPQRLESDLSAFSEHSLPDLERKRLAERLESLSLAQGFPVLVEVVAEALRRIVKSTPDERVAVCCQQAARVLESELRAAFSPAQSSQVA